MLKEIDRLDNQTDQNKDESILKFKQTGSKIDDHKKEADKRWNKFKTYKEENEKCNTPNLVEDWFSVQDKGELQYDNQHAYPDYNFYKRPDKDAVIPPNDAE